MRNVHRSSSTHLDPLVFKRIWIFEQKQFKPYEQILKVNKKVSLLNCVYWCLDAQSIPQKPSSYWWTVFEYIYIYILPLFEFKGIPVSILKPVPADLDNFCKIVPYPNKQHFFLIGKWKGELATKNFPNTGREFNMTF